MILKETYELIEGLIFIKGEEGLSINFLAEILDIKLNEAENFLNIFKEEHNNKNDVLVVKRFGSIYKMLVAENIYIKIKDKLENKNLLKLSKVALETLAIIAYNQPISKIEIDKIRGVNSESVLNSLLEKELIYSDKISDKIGKPKLYETTDVFLDIFGLSNIEELPKFENSGEVDANSIEEFLNN